MQKRFAVSTFGVLAMVVGLAACDNAPEAQAVPKMSNDDLDRAVTTRINDDAVLATYRLDVDADADKNEVTISGSVPSQSLRMKAVDAAKAAHAGLIINDKIDVKPGDVERAAYTDDMAREARARAAESKDSLGDSLDDAWIHTKIRSKLLAEGEFPGGSVNVDVANNVVTLRGNVATRAERTKAEEVAKTTEGVKSVRNQLVIKAAN